MATLFKIITIAKYIVKNYIDNLQFQLFHCQSRIYALKGPSHQLRPITIDLEWPRVKSFFIFWKSFDLVIMISRHTYDWARHSVWSLFGCESWTWISSVTLDIQKFVYHSMTIMSSSFLPAIINLKLYLWKDKN